jgi:SAM-dependent methyltransferase
MSESTPWQAPTRLFKGWSDAQNVISIIKAYGTRGALREVRSAALYRLAAQEGRRFDKTYGVETDALVRLTSLTLRSSRPVVESPNYVPSFSSMLRLAIRQLPGDLSEYVFIDMGSGKGRVLLTAAQFEFKRVIGVEFAEELHEQAQRNIVTFSGARQTREIQSVLSDARDFGIPEDKCVIYIFGTIAQYTELFDVILKNLERSYSRVPRAMFIAMLNVEAESIMRKFPVFKEFTAPSILADLVLRRIACLRIFATAEASNGGSTEPECAGR